MAEKTGLSDNYWFDVQSKNGAYSIYLPQFKTDHIQRFIASQNEPYEAELLFHMERFIKPGELFADIGANIGNHTMYMAKFGARVVGYEANQQLTDSVDKSLAKNQFAERVSIKNLALGAKSGHARFLKENAENLGAQELETGKGKINVTTLDEEKFDEPIKLIKIDVEGMELQVLQGGKGRIAKDRPVIYLEAATKDEFDAISNWFQAIDYGFAASFNASPTHLFLPEERYSANRKLVELREESARAVYYYYGAAQSANERIRKTRNQLLKSQSLNERAKEQNQRANEQVAKLRRSIEKQAKYRKSTEKYKTALLICALPVLIVLLPVLIPYHFYRRSKKMARLRNPPAVEHSTATHVVPGDLNLPGNNPSEVISFLSELDDPLAVESEFSETVSIIIPSFNNAEYLELAIKSAVYQVGVNVEVIVVDDCSTDDSLATASRLAKRHSNVKLVPLLRNFGCYYARNIGLLEATGDFVTIVDSDDIMHPERLFKQLSAIKKSKGTAIACQSQARRWTEDFSESVSEVKFVENTLLYPRSVIDDIGFYDSVRYGGDSEFRERLIVHYGDYCIARMAQELYYLRTTSQSLTELSSAYQQDGQNLQHKLSMDRFLYVSEFRDWHHKCKNDKTIPHVQFPQTNRSFELGEPGQNASPSMDQEIIGGMATFPERESVLESTIPHIVDQVDRIYIYLNGYDAVPEFLNHPKIHPVLGKNAEGDLRDNGKFFRLCDAEGYLFTFDDDIFYRKNFVARMVAQIENFGRAAVVGVHGVIFPDEKLEYLEERTVFHFNQKSPFHIVDLLGTGTTAYHSSTLKVNMTDFRSKGVCDLWFARLAHLQNVPLVSIARPAGLLTEVDRQKGETRLFDEAKNGGGEHTKLYHKSLYPLIAEGRMRKQSAGRMVDLIGADRLTSAGFDLG